MAGERKASDPRCVHGSWQGTYCPDCPANRAVFGAQRFLPSLTPPGERPERDVLALAAVIRMVDGGHDLGASALAEALIDAGYVLAARLDDGLCAECGHDDNEHVHYCSHETMAGSCYCNVEYAALSPDRPTPP